VLSIMSVRYHLTSTADVLMPVMLILVTTTVISSTIDLLYVNVR